MTKTYKIEGRDIELSRDEVKGVLRKFVDREINHDMANVVMDNWLRNYD